jgi:hypothetical protein
MALVEAHVPANEMSASIFTSDRATMVNFDKLDADGSITIPADLPSGVYALSLFGRWDDGDANYQFTLNVSGVAPFAADKMPIDGRCRPAMDMKVSVGDHWTLTGRRLFLTAFPLNCRLVWLRCQPSSSWRVSNQSQSPYNETGLRWIRFRCQPR